MKPLNLQKSEALYTPSAVVTICTKMVRYAAEEKKTLTIRGIYQGIGVKSYGGVYYDQLCDPFTDHTLTIKVPEKIRFDLDDGQEIVFEGVLERNVRKDGSIQMTVLVVDLQEKKKVEVAPEVEERMALLQKKASQGIAPVELKLKEALLLGETPTLALVFGEQAIVHEDVEKALKEAGLRYEIIDFRVNMSRPDEILDCVMEIQEGNYTAFALVRGGGSGMEVFDSLPLAKALIEGPVPYIAALGHAKDIPLAEKVADLSFATPTALGTFLRTVVEEVEEDRSKSKALAFKELEKQFEEQQKKERELFAKEKEFMEKQFQKQTQDLEVQLQHISARLQKMLIISAVVALVLGVVIGKLL